jgi:hypothetical protein
VQQLAIAVELAKDQGNIQAQKDLATPYCNRSWIELGRPGRGGEFAFEHLPGRFALGVGLQGLTEAGVGVRSAALVEQDLTLDAHRGGDFAGRAERFGGVARFTGVGQRRLIVLQRQSGPAHLDQERRGPIAAGDLLEDAQGLIPPR